MIDEAMGHIVGVLSGIRLEPRLPESAIQNAIAAALAAAGVAFDREFRLGYRSRIDFLCESGIGIEVKKGKPSRVALERQVRRYAEFDIVKGVIMVVEECIFDHIGEANNGKPVEYVSLAKAWGLAI